MGVEWNCYYLIRMRQCWATSIGHPDLLDALLFASRLLARREHGTC